MTQCAEAVALRFEGQLTRQHGGGVKVDFVARGECGDTVSVHRRFGCEANARREIARLAESLRAAVLS